MVSMDTEQTMGERLMYARRRAGMSRAALAAAAGTSRQTIQRIEAGEIASPSGAMCARLAAALGLDLAALIRGGASL